MLHYKSKSCGHCKTTAMYATTGPSAAVQQELDDVLHHDAVRCPRTSYVEQLEPGHRSTHGPLGINETIYNDGDTCNRHKT